MFLLKGHEYVWSLTEICDVFSKLTAIGVWEILYRFLACCSEDVSVDGSWGGAEKKKEKEKEAFEFPQKKPKNMLAFSMNIGGAVEFLCNAINVTAPPVVKSNNKDEHLPRCSRFFHLSWLRFCTAATRLQLPASFQKTLQHTAATGGKQMWKSPQLKDDYRCFNMIT